MYTSCQILIELYFIPELLPIWKAEPISMKMV